MDVEATRAAFEDIAYGIRFMKSIKRVGTGCTTFQPVGLPDKADFVKRNDAGDYIDQPLAVMWEVWQKATEAETQRCVDVCTAQTLRFKDRSASVVALACADAIKE